jgi:hypothetical protein
VIISSKERAKITGEYINFLFSIKKKNLGLHPNWNDGMMGLKKFYIIKKEGYV